MYYLYMVAPLQVKLQCSHSGVVTAVCLVSGVLLCQEYVGRVLLCYPLSLLS